MKKLLTVMLAAACLASCAENEPTAPVSGGRISIDPIITRATEVNFETGDQVGLTVIKQESESVYAANRLMTFAGSVFSGDLEWYAEASDAAHLVAYYPYASAGAPASFTVAADQTTGYGASDLMAASKGDVMPSVNSISMTFKHLLTKIVFDVDNESGSDIISIVLKGSVPTADVDLKALTVAVDGTASAADITAQQVTVNTLYRAIVVPQTVAFTLEVTTGAETITQNLASTILKQGGQYSIDVRILPGDIEVTMSGEIENWTDEGKIGEASDEPDFEEHLDENYFVYDGETYATVTLGTGTRAVGQTVWMAEPLRYIPAGYTPSADPTEESHIWYPYETVNPDGVSAIAGASVTALTDDASVRKFGYLYDMYAALGGVEVTEENCYNYEGVRGICPPGWNIPTRADFYALCGLSSKNALGETGNQVNSAALFHDTGYGGGKMTLYNDGGWNYVMSGARQRNGYSATPQYQNTQVWSGNTTEAGMAAAGIGYGDLALTYITSSTCYQPTYNSTSGELSNIQFFAQMTTFSKSYPEGRINVAYASYLAGLQLRCVKYTE